MPYRSAGGLSTSGTARRYPWQPCEQEPPKLTDSPRCLEGGGAREQGDTGPPNYPQKTPSTKGCLPDLRKQEGNNRNTHTAKSRDPPAEGGERPILLQKPAVGAGMHCPTSQESCSDKDARASEGVRIYNSYALLVHRPKAWIKWSGIPLRAATVAAPMRKLWLEKFPAIPAAAIICLSH